MPPVSVGATHPSEPEVRAQTPTTSKAIEMLEAGLSRYLTQFNKAMSSLMGYKLDGMPQALLGSHRVYNLATSSFVGGLLNLSLATEMAVRHTLLPSVELLRLEV